jgi:hypothetical protein
MHNNESVGIVIIPVNPMTHLLYFTKKGTIKIKTEVNGIKNNIVVTDVELVPGLQKNLISYVRLEQKRVRIIYQGSNRYLANAKDERMVEVHEYVNLLVVRSLTTRAEANADLICNVFAEQAVHKDTLDNFHDRFGYSNYKSIRISGQA